MSENKISFVNINKTKGLLEILIFLSRKIFILKRINFRADAFERKVGTNFRAFWTFLRECAKISTNKVFIFLKGLSAGCI